MDYITLNKVTVILTQWPRLNRGLAYQLPADYVYVASAKDAQDNEYNVIWNMLDGYDVKDKCSTGIFDDESTACDWDHPAEIRAL